MPWEKNFEIGPTLTQAMNLFWARGFEATSIQDLVRVTGVNRASLYATYGDKREIFLAALRKYDTEVRCKMLRQFAEVLDPADAIRGVFDKFIDQSATQDGNWGCFLTNTSLELAAHDPEIAALVNAAQDEMEAYFFRMIQAGQETGEFNAALDAAMLARQTLTTLLGLLVLIRSRPDRVFLKAVRDGALSRLL